MAIVLTPSRYCAIATVQSSFHIPPTGMQQGAIDFGEPRGFPLKYKLMPQYFQDLGYETHMVGKVSTEILFHEPATCHFSPRDIAVTNEIQTSNNSKITKRP